MSIFTELNYLISKLNLPVETGVFSDAAPDEYCVLTSLLDDFVLFCDNTPLMEVAEVRISLFCKGNYLSRARQITSALLAADFTITHRLFLGHENDTGYNHYAIDVAKEYEMEE